MKTYSPKKGEVDRNWYVVDASDQTVGRLCTEVARLLTGKHKPQYAPHIDTGDFVIVINAEKAVFSGRKNRNAVVPPIRLIRPNRFSSTFSLIH